MEGPPLGPGGEDITWPDQVAPRGHKASSTRKIKPQTSNLKTTKQNIHNHTQVKQSTKQSGNEVMHSTVWHECIFILHAIPG